MYVILFKKSASTTLHPTPPSQQPFDGILVQLSPRKVNLVHETRLITSRTRSEQEVIFIRTCPKNIDKIVNWIQDTFRFV